MQDPNTHNPPEWPFKLLRSFCKDSLIERIEGDVLESFDFRVKVLGVKKARLLLYRDIISMFRPIAFKGLLFKKSNHKTIIFNYI